MSKVERNKKRLLLIDGHSLAYRAYYALPVENFTTTQGQPTNMLFGFASMLINILKTENPTHVAAAFDVSRNTFRKELFTEYKAQRAKTPDEFRSQLDYLHSMLEGFGVQQFSLEGFEADDLLATIANQAESEGFTVSICTGDRDAFQLVNEHVTVLYPKKGVTDLSRMTPDAVYEKYELTPTQYPDFAALRGDPSDNLPSVPGVGEKTAAKWIREYGTLETLLDSADELPGKSGESLREHIESVRLNHRLTHLRRDVPLNFSTSQLAWQGVRRSSVEKLFGKLEIKNLQGRLRDLPAQEKQDEAESSVSVRQREVAFISPDISMQKIAEARRSELVAFIPQIHEGRLSGYSFSVGGESFYVQDGEIQPWMSDPKVSKVVHGAKEIVRQLPIQGIVFDTEIAAYLLSPGSRELELEDLLSTYLGEEVGEKGDLFSDAPAINPGSLIDLEKILEEHMRKHSCYELFRDVEMPTTFALAQMERIGIHVDKEFLVKLAKDFQDSVDRESQSAYTIAGHEFNVNSPKQLQTILFEELKLPKTKKIKTGYTTDAESLEVLYAKTQNPLLAHLMKIREMGKLRSTIEGLLDSIADDGRIHTVFQQTITATGRLSSTDPNLQNIPIRSEEGRRIREAFTAEQPFVGLLTADYSQIELRIMAHLSDDAGLIEAFTSGEDLHSTVAGMVFGVKPSEVDAEMRRQIKAMSYGLAYGLSSYGLSQQLGLSATEASELIDKYYSRFGGIREYLQSVVVKARETGYTETILGRRRYLPDLRSDNRPRREIAERMALNAPIQGSAADIIKVAMLHLSQGLSEKKLHSRLLLQVHDELILEVAPGEEEVLSTLVRETMEGAFTLKLPLEVNIGIGKSWDAAAH